MKEKILDAAEALVQSRGLNGVTFQDIAEAVGLRKPSLFHHVKNKEELALLLIDRCSTKHGPKYAEVVAKDLNAPEKLIEVVGIFEEALNQERPCLLAALGSGLESLSPSAVSELHKATDGAVERFAMIFQQGRDEDSLKFEGNPEHAAMGFFAMLQGLQTLCRAKGNTREYKQAALTYIDSITKS